MIMKINEHKLSLQAQDLLSLKELHRGDSSDPWGTAKNQLFLFQSQKLLNVTAQRNAHTFMTKDVFISSFLSGVWSVFEI